MGFRFKAVNEKPRIKKREFLKAVHALICSVHDDGTPVAIQQKFEKIDVANYTEEQVETKFNYIKTLLTQWKHSQEKK